MKHLAKFIWASILVIIFSIYYLGFFLWHFHFNIPKFKIKKPFVLYSPYDTWRKPFGKDTYYSYDNAFDWIFGKMDLDMIKRRQKEHRDFF